MYNANMPIGYQMQSYVDFCNMKPQEVKGVWNASTEFHKRYLWWEIYSVFKFTLPDTWELNWFRFWLFHFGSIAGLYTKENGWIAYPYGIEKLGLYYQPKDIIVTSPMLKGTKRGRIGVNAEIIKIFDDYYSLNDLVTRYATKLANIDKAIEIALMNSNVAFVFGASDKKQAEEIKTAYSSATQGTPLVTMNKDALGDGVQPFFPSVSSNFIVDKLLAAKRTVINEFLTKVGIKNANYDKKERLNSQEVNANDDEVKSIVSIIYDNISVSFERLNKLSNGALNLKVEYAFEYEKEVLEDG